jgi:hypothetical protein
MWHRREIMRFGGIQVGGEVRGRDLTCQRKEFWSLVAFLPPVPRSNEDLHAPISDFFENPPLSLVMSFSDFVCQKTETHDLRVR